MERKFLVKEAETGKVLGEEPTFLEAAELAASWEDMSGKDMMVVEETINEENK
jgi:hypothetical protein